MNDQASPLGPVPAPRHSSRLSGRRRPAHRPLLLAWLTLAVLPLPLHRALAQQCTYNFNDDYEQLTRLTNENQKRPNGTTDAVTVPVTDSPASDLMETWYVPRLSGTSCSAGTSPLYRVYDSSLVDHADTPVIGNPAGYTADPTLPSGMLACPWNSSARQGVLPLTRYFESSPAADYITWLDTAPAGYAQNAVWSTSSSTPLLGYQRFGNNLTNFSGAYGTYSLDDGFLHVDFNQLWGNAIGQIIFEGTNDQIVRNPGPGFLVQTVLWVGTPTGCSVANPTQSGATPCNARNEALWAGSPLIGAPVRTGTDPSQPQTLTSVIRPLDFCSDGQQDTSSGAWPGADPASPLAWRGFFQRADTLGCNLNGAVRKDVIASTSQAMLGNGTTKSSVGAGQWNTYWLNEPDDATQGHVQLQWEDLETGVITPIAISYQSGLAKFSLNNQTCTATNGCNSYTLPPNGHSQALMVTSTVSTFGYALVVLNPQTYGDELNIAVNCSAAPCAPASVVVVLNDQRFVPAITSTAWSPPMTSHLVVNNLSPIKVRLGELNAYGGTCTE